MVSTVILKHPTSKQEEVLRLLAKNGALWGVGYITEIDLHVHCGMSPQAGIALLSSMVRSGWAESIGNSSGTYWRLTADGKEAIDFFA